MQTREWALVAFTLLMQLSIGTLLVVVALPLGVPRGAHPPTRLFDLPLLLAGLCAGASLLVSLLHLGHPAQAWLALTNVRTSWLSREIVASVLFVAAAGLFVLRRRGGPTAPLDATTVVVVLLGLAVLYTMSRLYMVPAQPAWNRVLTPLGFFLGALLLGAVFVLTTPIIAARLGWPPGDASIATAWALDPALAQTLAFVAMGLLAAQALLTPIYVAGLPAEPAAAISAASLGQSAAWLAAGRIAAAIVALVFLRGLVVAAPGAPASIPLGILAFALVATSELLGRLLFYAGSVRIGPF
jgi:anaerobic dimethyl sulfoxide reductase subunit C (anchor subunit)